MKKFNKKVGFYWPDKISIDGKEADLTSHSRSSTAYQRAPFLTDHEIRLFLPYIVIKVMTETIVICPYGIGDNWTEKIHPGKVVIMKSTNSGMLLNDLLFLQTKDKTHNQVLRQAQLFKKKSDLFAPYGICPPVGDLLKIEDVESKEVWPRMEIGEPAQYVVQMTERYIEKFGSIWGLEVKNANLLSPGSWEIEDGKAYNPYIKDKYDRQIETHGGAIASNFINGYYIDWDLWYLDTKALKK